MSRGRDATTLSFLRLGALVALTLLGCLDLPARADPIADFYRGRELRLIISSSVGGGYDVYGRLIARHLGRHLAGSPTIVPQNMPAASGLAAANHLYAIAPKDGSVIAVLQNTIPFEPFFDNKQALFDAARFNWLGTPSAEVAVYLIYHTSKIETLRDAQTHEFLVGGVGPAGTPAFYGRIFNQILGLKARLITGYPGQNEILLAMESGEIEGMASPFWSSLKANRPTWYPQHKARFLFQYGAQPHPELPEVPFAPDLIGNADDRILLAAAVAPLGLGRPFAAPPGVPTERVAALRAALMATFKDPAFIAECDAQRLECAVPQTGDEIARVIGQAYATPDAIRRRLVAIQNGTAARP